MKRILIIAFCALCVSNVTAEEGAANLGTPHFARFGQGTGPTQVDGVLRLLDRADTPRQTNSVGFDRTHAGAHESVTLKGKLRIKEGGDGGAVAFLATDAHGTAGPAPFLTSAVEPNLKGSFAVGIDVHNPPSKEQFTPWGNYMDLPQREISLHWDGREIVKRVAPKEFRGEVVPFEITLRHVIGGANATVVINGGTVYEDQFLPGIMPYELRVGAFAGTRADASTCFDLQDLALTVGEQAKPRRRPLRVEVFNHVLTNNKKTFYDAEVALPPLEWAFGRVLMTIEIHDAGKDWDEWDRNGEVLLIGDDGTKQPIVPFITSYRTPCHWVFDVTHFRPWLTGTRTFRIAAGTTFYKNRGYMMSLALDFHHGTPALMPHSVEPLWVGRARHGTAENHFQDFYPDRTVTIAEGTKAARVYTTTTGHSQVGEFTPSKRTLIVQPGGNTDGELRFDNQLWKTDVYLNPNRPQFGTWQYARAGWAPGDVVWPWIVDLGDKLPVGKDTTFRYMTYPYEFPAGREPSTKELEKANHVQRSYLVLYRDAGGLVAAPTLMITSVTKNSSADAAGIKAGDYLARYDDKPINSVDDLRAAIQGAAGKETVPVVVFRGVERLEKEMKSGRMGISLANR